MVVMVVMVVMERRDNSEGTVPKRSVAECLQEKGERKKNMRKIVEE